MTWLLGLRGRLTAALFAVSALALAIAAVSLLVRLDALLRDDALTSLTEEARTARSRIAALSEADRRAGSPALQRAVLELAREASAEVAIVDERGRTLVGSNAAAGRRFLYAAPAIRDRRLVSGTVTKGEATEARVAIPFEVGGGRFALGLRRSLDDVDDARSVVERAVIIAALISLAGALLVGTALAGRLVRRLAALRDTSLRLAEMGPLVEVQDDGTRDEVGDLTRAFAMMQRRLRDQEQARRTFVATASHELRTPLASLRLMLYSAREELDEPQPDLQDMREQLSRAVGQTERLSKLAAELLDLSRLDAGVPLRSESVELEELARAVLAEFDPRAERTGASLRLRVSEPQWATADPGSVAQILRVLLDNALRHSPPAAPIDVEIGATGGHVTISVSDAGPGVAPADAERIFERFERGADAAGESGFGLGLAIGRELARRMGGDLRLDAGDPGARFRLLLPQAVMTPDGESVEPRI